MLELFLPIAHAQTAAAPAPSSFGMLALFVPLMAIMYFMMIRPQQKRAKEHRNLLEALKKGDEVVSAGGIVGRIAQIGDNFILLEVAPNTEIRVQRHAITSLMPKGTYKGDL